MGITGMGGGLVMTPLLVFFFGVPPTSAVGTDLVYAGITKIFGFIQHWRQKTIDLFTVKWMIIASAPGALIGVGMIFFFHTMSHEQAELWLGKILGITFVIVSLLMASRVWFRDKQTIVQKFILKTGPLTKKKLLGIGSIGGFMVGLTSVGSGSLFIALLSTMGNLAPAVLVGTDIAHGALLTLTAGMAHSMIGTVDYALVGNLLLGSIPGILLGSRLTVSIPENWVRSALILILLFTGVKLL